MRPIIGVVFCGLENNRQFVTDTYLEAIHACHAIPIIIPYLSVDTLTSSYESIFLYYIRLCNGFLFCGGEDISPCLFHEDLKTDIGSTDIKTDLYQLLLMKEVLLAGRPILSICRGMQVLNVALGGTLIQDISLRNVPSLNHMQISKDRSDPCHSIHIKTFSLLHKLFGEHCYVNSFHHQCIGCPGQNLTITAYSADGIAEAIELPGHPFTLGVQWHPECMVSCNPHMKDLFLTFTESCKTENTTI